MTVPVIDLFAGPGGLGEGFSRSKSADFKIAVSIEKDGMAFETLRLRAAHRSLWRSGQATPMTWKLWDTVLADSPWNIAVDNLAQSGNPLIMRACDEARAEAWNLEMGPANRTEVSEGIRARLRPYMSGGRLPSNSVLIGGPPCQAYSIVGRSRNRGTRGYKAEDDPRHFLYREYLSVISEFRPAIFIMENVKGILSSRVQERQLFKSILTDLRRPDIASGFDVQLEYELVALGKNSAKPYDIDPEQFVVHAESHGVPQARHRVVICGIRRDVFRATGPISKLAQMAPPTVRDVIADLPRVRSALSYRGNGMKWEESFEAPIVARAITELNRSNDPTKQRIASVMEASRNAIRGQSDPGIGGERTVVGSCNSPPLLAHSQWNGERPLSLLANHESRSHMPTDLVRYLFAASFGEVTGSSPRLKNFPMCLLPDHKNVNRLRPEDAIFKDRFRVQVADYHATTVTSHIAKDGHAFIHFDPSQCRSLTVREAARLQTFPDSYVFLGNRTSQYTQVGNAVPPYLAYQIAEIVGEVLRSAGLGTQRNMPLDGTEHDFSSLQAA